MKTYKIISLILIIFLFATGCTQSADPTPTVVAPQEQAVTTAKELLVETSGAVMENILVISVEAVDWSSSCLGVELPIETCAQVITPGYKILMNYNGRYTEVHTDATGANARLALGWGSSEPDEVVLARQALAETLGVEADLIRVVDLVTMEWSDACMGISREGGVCAQVLTQGYRVTLSYEDVSYVYHVNLGGSLVIMAGESKP